MPRRMVIVAMALAYAACADHNRESAVENGPATEGVPQTPPINPETIKPGEPGGLPDDRASLAEPNGPIDPKSTEGAGQVMQLFGGLLEQRRFAEAYRLWSDAGRASGLTEAQFVAAHDKYAEIHSQVGRPGQPEGAAGSVYVDVPFRLYGKLTSGGAFNLVGTVTLRRVNDVPGSTEEQRRWHISRSDLDARP